MIALFYALLAVGSVAPRVQIPDQNGVLRAFPEEKQPILLIIEDQEGGKQNRPLKERLGRINSDPANRAKCDVIAIADLSRWDWWPARKYALADVQKTATEKKTTIYLDWKGELKRAWGVQKGKNHLLLLMPDGKVRFAAEGPVSGADEQNLINILVELGVRP